MASILIIEDQEKLAKNIAAYLETEFHTVSLAFDGEAGLHKALVDDYDLIILDLNLPKLDGLQVCSLLRKEGNTVPVLMLTARVGVEATVAGLDIGADDYLPKPFELSELLARIRALLRRQSPTKTPLLALADITLDTNTHEVRKAGALVNLAPREYSLLEFLFRHQGIAQDRLTILERVWGESPDLIFSQTVDVHVAYLRKKVGKTIIKTVPGKGYFVPESL